MRAFDFFDGDDVFDVGRVQDLSAEVFRNQTSPDTFACGIDSRCGSSGATADDQNVERGFCGDFFRFAFGTAGIDLGQNFLDVHATLTEFLAIEENGRNSHDVAFVDFILEEGAIDHDMRNVRVDDGHQIQCLYDFRTILAAQGNIGLEPEGTFQVSDLFDDVRFDFGGIAAGLEQCQNERGEFVSHRESGKTDVDVAVRPIDRKRGRSFVATRLVCHGNHG